MAGYTIVNMNDLEDSAAGRDGVEARFARKHLDSEHLGVSYFASSRASDRPGSQPRRPGGGYIVPPAPAGSSSTTTSSS